MEKTNKINFFKRLKIAIFNLDEYGIFIEEKLSVAVKYMLLIVLFSSIVLSIVTTYELSNELKKGLSYFENEFPEFSFDDTTLHVNRYIEGYDQEFDVKIIADTSNLEKSKIDEYINKTKDAGVALVVLNDKIVYRNYNTQNEIYYKDLDNILPIKDSNKDEIIEQFNSLGGTNSIITTSAIVAMIALFIENVIELFFYITLVTLVGLIVGRICGIAMRLSVAISLSIYSLTVPVLCSVIYGVVYNFTGFEIKYFSAMYLMIAYVYIIAAILIIKTDLMKQSQELMRIKSVEEQIKEELERQAQEEQENNKEDGEEENSDQKEDNKEDEPKPKANEPNIEPDGSEI